MIILAIDTSMQACSAAVLAGAALAREFEARSRGHAEAIVPMIQRVMRQAGVTFEMLDKIAVTTGPGTFTGVRIGVATARGLALAAKVPLVSETSLAVMAHQVLGAPDAPGTEHVAIAADARRGQVYWALFDRSGNVRSQPVAATPGDAVQDLPATPVTVAGTGAGLVEEAARAAERSVVVAYPDLQPDAATLAALSRDLLPDTEPVAPLYLRPPDAKSQAGKALPWQT